MAQRGRKSAASLEIVAAKGNTTEVVPRPEPPEGLTPDQVDVWLEIVNSLPADWIKPESQALLKHYCRHIVSGNRVAELIATLEQQPGPFDTDEYDKLLKMQEREGRAASSLATRLRITPQSYYDPKKVKKNQPDAPWLRQGRAGTGK